MNDCGERPTDDGLGWPIVEVVVAALDGGIEQVVDKLLPTIPATPVLIVHQLTNDAYRWPHALPPDVRYLPRYETGLSRSRNVGLEHARGDVVVVADEDVTYTPNAVQLIRAAWQRDRSAAAITFRHTGMQHWPERFRHRRRTIGQVSSICVTYRPDWVRSAGIRFDTRFGLGAKWPQGEENIFLADIGRKGCVIAAPGMIVDDPGVTSGHDYSMEAITAKIVVARRMYGWFAGLAATVHFAVKKRRLWQAQDVSWPRYLVSTTRGLAVSLRSLS